MRRLKTLLISFIVKGALGSMRTTIENERIGLDLAEHGEEGYLD